MIRLSLALRFKLGVAFSILIVLSTGFLSIYYLHSLNEEIQNTLHSDLSLLGIIERATQALEKSQAREILSLRPGSEPASCTDLIVEMQQIENDLKKNFEAQKSLGASETLLLGEIRDCGWALGRTCLATPGERLPLIFDLLERHRSILSGLGRLDTNRRRTVAAHLVALADVSKTAQERMAMIAIISIGIAIVMSIFFSQQITLPVRRLKELIAHMRDGDYDIAARPQPEDEIGQIFNSLVRAAEHIAIRDRLKVEKIDLERRRFATLANHVGIPLLLVNAKNQIAHANNGALELFRLAYDDIFEVELSRAPLPPKLKEHLSIEARKNDFPIDLTIVYAVDPKELALSLTLIPVENAKGDLISAICLMQPIER